METTSPTSTAHSSHSRSGTTTSRITAGSRSSTKSAFAGQSVSQVAQGVWAG